MKPVDKKSKNRSSSGNYLQEQCVLLRSGEYWNCLAAAQKLAVLLLAEGKSPWLGRLRETEVRGGRSLHHPLIPHGLSVAAAWTTHYVCCCDGMAYDPVAGKAIHLEAYSLVAFGKQISVEIFVPAEELPAYICRRIVDKSLASLTS